MKRLFLGCCGPGAHKHSIVAYDEDDAATQRPYYREDSGLRPQSATGGLAEPPGANVGQPVASTAPLGCAPHGASQAALFTDETQEAATRDRLLVEATNSVVTVFALDGGQVLHQNAASVRFYGTRCLDTAFRPLNQHFAAVGDISRRGSQPGQDNVLSQLFVLEPDKLHRMLRAVAAAAAPPAQPGNTPPGPPRWKGMVRVPHSLAPPPPSTDSLRVRTHASSSLLTTTAATGHGAEYGFNPMPTFGPSARSSLDLPLAARLGYSDAGTGREVSRSHAFTTTSVSFGVPQEEGPAHPATGVGTPRAFPGPSVSSAAPSGNSRPPADAVQDSSYHSTSGGQGSNRSSSVPRQAMEEEAARSTAPGEDEDAQPASHIDSRALQPGPEEAAAAGDAAHQQVPSQPLPIPPPPKGSLPWRSRSMIHIRQQSLHPPTLITTSYRTHKLFTPLHHGPAPWTPAASLPNPQFAVASTSTSGPPADPRLSFSRSGSIRGAYGSFYGVLSPSRASQDTNTVASDAPLTPPPHLLAEGVLDEVMVGAGGSSVATSTLSVALARHRGNSRGSTASWKGLHETVGGAAAAVGAHLAATAAAVAAAAGVPAGASFTSTGGTGSFEAAAGMEGRTLASPVFSPFVQPMYTNQQQQQMQQRLCCSPPRVERRSASVTCSRGGYPTHVPLAPSGSSLPCTPPRHTSKQLQELYMQQRQQQQQPPALGVHSSARSKVFKRPSFTPVAEEGTLSADLKTPSPAKPAFVPSGCVRHLSAPALTLLAVQPLPMQPPQHRQRQPQELLPLAPELPPYPLLPQRQSSAGLWWAEAAPGVRVQAPEGPGVPASLMDAASSAEAAARRMRSEPAYRTESWGEQGRRLRPPTQRTLAQAQAGFQGWAGHAAAAAMPGNAPPLSPVAPAYPMVAPQSPSMLQPPPSTVAPPARMSAHPHPQWGKAASFAGTSSTNKQPRRAAPGRGTADGSSASTGACGSWTGGLPEDASTVASSYLTGHTSLLAPSRSTSKHMSFSRSSRTGAPPLHQRFRSSAILGMLDMGFRRKAPVMGPGGAGSSSAAAEAQPGAASSQRSSSGSRWFQLSRQTSVEQQQQQQLSVPVFERISPGYGRSLVRMTRSSLFDHDDMCIKEDEGSSSSAHLTPTAADDPSGALLCTPSMLAAQRQRSVELAGKSDDGQEGVEAVAAVGSPNVMLPAGASAGGGTWCMPSFDVALRPMAARQSSGGVSLGANSGQGDGRFAKGAAGAAMQPPPSTPAMLALPNGGDGGPSAAAARPPSASVQYMGHIMSRTSAHSSYTSATATTPAAAASAAAAAAAAAAAGPYCWHRVVATRAVDPVSGRPVLVVTQDDVTAKVLVERHVALAMETEHRLLEQLFPDRILRCLAEELLAQDIWDAEQQRVDSQEQQQQNETEERAAAGPGEGEVVGSGRSTTTAIAAGAAGAGPGADGARRSRRRRRYSIHVSPQMLHQRAALATQQPQVTLLVADIKGFTPMSGAVAPQAVMAMLNDLFSRFDALLDLYGVRKIETIGDAYLVASGLVEDGPRGGRGSKPAGQAAAAAQEGAAAAATALEEQGGPAPGPLGRGDLAAVSQGAREGGLERPGEVGSTAVEGAEGVWGQPPAAEDARAAANAAQRAFRFAKAMLRAARHVSMPHDGRPVELRIGMHTGPVVSGVVGSNKPKYCLFGPGVTVATRLEASGQAGCVHVSHHTWQLLQQGGAAAAAPAAPAAALVHAGQAGAWEEGPGLQVRGMGDVQTHMWVPTRQRRLG